MLYAFFPERNYGWIRANTPITIPDSEVGFTLDDDIYTADHDIAFEPNVHQPVPVTFQLYQDSRGKGACSVTRSGKEGVGPIVDGNPQRFTGTVLRCKTHYSISIRPNRDLSYLGVIDCNLHLSIIIVNKFCL